LAAAAWAAALTVLNGCAPTSERGPAARSITLDEFVLSSPSARSPRNSPDLGRMDAHDSTPSKAATVDPSGSAGNDTAETSGRVPANARSRPARPIATGEPVIVDRVVGQVSGRPIFADDLLEPIADQLRQESERLDRRTFTERAVQIVTGRLTEVVVNELFLAEAEATLTTQQQQGLLYFLKELQEKELAEQGGLRSLFEKKTQQEGLTPEEFLALERDRMLIDNLIREKISPRVIVSWKDIEREYERRRGEFNPPSRVTLQRLSLETTQPQLIEQVKSRLEAGESFSTVAEFVARSDDAAVVTLDPYPMGPGGMSDIEGLADIYKPHLESLAEGQTTKPIEREGRIVWLHVLRIEQPPPRSLYDVQRQLSNELHIRRFSEQKEKYVRSLLDRGIYSELEEMSRRVLEVAIVRYGR
jgi:hypothetical protein